MMAPGTTASSLSARKIKIKCDMNRQRHTTPPPEQIESVVRLFKPAKVPVPVNDRRVPPL